MTRRLARARPPRRLTTALPTHDLAAARDFYVRELGLTVDHEDAGSLLLRVGDARLRFVQHDGALALGGEPALTFDCPDPTALLERLRAIGVEVDVPPSRASHGAIARFEARDPDGRTIAFRASARRSD